MTTKTSAKKRKPARAAKAGPAPEANGAPTRLLPWQIEMEKTIDRLLKGKDWATEKDRDWLRQDLQPVFEYAGEYVVFQFHWVGRGKNRRIEKKGTPFHHKDWDQVRKFLATIPGEQQQFYTVDQMD